MMLRRNLHFIATALLLILCYPFAHAANLRLDGPLQLLKQMLPPLFVQACFLAAILYALAYPADVKRQIQSGDQRRFILLIPLAVFMFYLDRWDTRGHRGLPQ